MKVIMPRAPQRPPNIVKPTQHPPGGIRAHSGDPGSGAKQRPQVAEPVEQMPHVRRGASVPVRMQVGQRGVLPVALEGRPGLPFDEDEHLPRSDVARRALPEPAQSKHAPPCRATSRADRRD